MSLPGGLEWADAEIVRVERAAASLRARIAETTAAIESRAVVRSFERLLAFEAAVASGVLHGGSQPGA